MNDNTYTKEKLSRKKVFRRLIGYTRPHLKKMLLTFVVLMAATAADVVGPILVKIFIDDYLTPRNFDVHALVILGGSYILLYLVSAGLNYYQLLNFQTIALWIIQQLRIDVFGKVQHLGLDFFDKTPGGSLVSRITNDTEAIKELYVGVLSAFVQNITILVGIFIGMFILNVRLALFCLVLIPVILALMYTYRRLSSGAYRLSREKLSQLNAKLNESLQGMNIIQALRQEKRMRHDFGKINLKHNNARMKTIKLNGLLLRPHVLYLLALVLVLGFFGVKSFAGPVEIGVLYAFVNYLDRFFEPVEMMMERLTEFQQAIVSAERVFGLLDEDRMAPDKTGKASPSVEKGKVTFQNVYFSYDGKTNVLKDISFTAYPGETVALVGHTGSGKSSIINLLMRFYTVQGGKITIDGVPLADYDNKELRDKMGLVLQDPFLFAGDVKQNIRLSRASISDEEVEEAARFVQADPFIEKLANQYDEAVGERGSSFSSGQRQLISFARTMARNPKILVLDEATASVDTETEEAIQIALRKMYEGRTTIAIAHRLSTIQYADLILVLHQGEIVERGNHQELLSQRGLYQKMYLLQQGVTIS